MLKNSFSLHMLLCFSLFSFSFFFMMSSLIMMFYNSLLIIEWKVFNSCGVFFSLPLMFDFINLMFASVVVFISANVMLFSNMYMKGEIFISRFLIIVVLFIVSMLFLLFIPHVIKQIM